VTVAGLMELEGHPQLRTLYVFDTQVTDADITNLRKALPDCKISR
jgi:hypothetical protein